MYINSLMYIHVTRAPWVTLLVPEPVMFLLIKKIAQGYVPSFK